MRPKWMVDDDVTILRFLEEHDFPMTAQIMAFELDIGYHQLRKRVSILNDHGMVEQPDHVPEGLSARGVYEITDFGRKFLSGELTLKEFRERDPTENGA